MACNLTQRILEINSTLTSSKFEYLIFKSCFLLVKRNKVKFKIIFTSAINVLAASRNLIYSNLTVIFHLLHYLVYIQDLS